MKQLELKAHLEKSEQVIQKSMEKSNLQCFEFKESLTDTVESFKKNSSTNKIRQLGLDVALNIINANIQSFLSESTEKQENMQKEIKQTEISVMEAVKGCSAADDHLVEKLHHLEETLQLALDKHRKKQSELEFCIISAEENFQFTFNEHMMKQLELGSCIVSAEENFQLTLDKHRKKQLELESHIISAEENFQKAVEACSAADDHLKKKLNHLEETFQLTLDKHRKKQSELGSRVVSAEKKFHLLLSNSEKLMEDLETKVFIMENSIQSEIDQSLEYSEILNEMLEGYIQPLQEPYTEVFLDILSDEENGSHDVLKEKLILLDEELKVWKEKRNSLVKDILYNRYKYGKEKANYDIVKRENETLEATMNK